MIHTVGPIGECEQLLENCYNSCLRLVKEYELSSVVCFSILHNFEGSVPGIVDNKKASD